MLTYNLDGENKTREPWSFQTILRKLLGITPEYTRGDKFIAWFFFLYSFVYGFLFSFILVWIWNLIAPWPVRWWSSYFFVVILGVPAVMAFISTFWFGIGGVKDMIQLFKDLKQRVINPLDNGMVEGSMSLADKQQLEAAERQKEASDREH